MCGAAPERFKVLGIRLNRSQGRNPASARGAAVTIVRCRRCDLIFPDPQPVPGSLHDHYDMPGEEYWQDSRAEAVADPAAVKRFTELHSRYPAGAAARALDVGVGSGFTAMAMIAAGFEVHGFEPIPQFRELALKTLGLPADRIRLAGIEQAEYPAESFDLVNFGAVLEHLYDPGGALAKAVGWLRPGGRIVLEVPSANWLIARLINRFFRLKGTAYVTHCSPMHSPFHLYEFSAKSFAENGARLGYRVEDLTIDVGTDPTMPTSLQRLLRPVMAVSGTGMMLHAVLQKL
jgi:SAM-dependent methyltransferase